MSVLRLGTFLTCEALASTNVNSLSETIHLLCRLPLPIGDDKGRGGVDVVGLFKALLSFVESAPQA